MIKDSKNTKYSSSFEEYFKERQKRSLERKQNSLFGNVQEKLGSATTSNNKSPILKKSYTTPTFPKVDLGTNTNTNTNTSTSTTKKAGSVIKSNIQNVVSKKYGELDTKHLFDGIDDKDIENNIPTAENAIKTNINSGLLKKDYTSKYPNLLDGLALSYAAADRGNNKAATRARDAAYTEQSQPSVKKEKIQLLSTEVPKNHSTTTLKEKLPSLADAYSFNNNEKTNSAKTNQAIRSNTTNGIRFKASTLIDDANAKDTAKSAEYPTDFFVKDLLGETQKNDSSSHRAPESEKINPSSELTSYLVDYFSNEYNAGKETVNMVLDESNLEHLHKYLSDGVKNAERPNNIGKGVWAKQVENNLKWVDDVFGKSSKFAKMLKSVPAITIGIDTLLGVDENFKNKSSINETFTDAGIDIGFGALEALAAAGAGTFVGGGIPGLAASLIAGLLANYALDSKEYIKGKTAKEIFDSLF